MLPEGGLVIDTPGMREIQLWDAEEGIQEAFEDIETLAATCFFNDCRHEDEPKCAVRAAIDEGILAAERLESYNKLQKELLFLEKKQSTANKAALKKSKLKPQSNRSKASDYEAY
jgi:ribosome biogenesis GTPase